MSSTRMSTCSICGNNATDLLHGERYCPSCHDHVQEALRDRARDLFSMWRQESEYRHVHVASPAAIKTCPSAVSA